MDRVPTYQQEIDRIDPEGQFAEYKFMIDEIAALRAILDPAMDLAESYGFTSVLQAVTTAGQYIQGKKPDVAPSASLGPSLIPPKTYLVTITFDDGTFRGRATSTSDFNAYQLVLQDARMGNVSGPQYHGKVLDWKAQEVTR